MQTCYLLAVPSVSAADPACGTLSPMSAPVVYLCHAHETLIALHTSIARPVSLRQAALRHSRETHMALVRHVARHGPHPLIARTLDAACMTLHADSSARH